MGRRTVDVAGGPTAWERNAGKDELRMWAVKLREQRDQARDALRDLSVDASLDDPNLLGVIPCWCLPRGPFASGGHDDACLNARAALGISSPANDEDQHSAEGK